VIGTTLLLIRFLLFEKGKKEGKKKKKKKSLWRTASRCVGKGGGTGQAILEPMSAIASKGGEGKKKRGGRGGKGEGTGMGKNLSHHNNGGDGNLLSEEG